MSTSYDFYGLCNTFRAQHSARHTVKRLVHVTRYCYYYYFPPLLTCTSIPFPKTELSQEHYQLDFWVKSSDLKHLPTPVV